MTTLAPIIHRDEDNRPLEREIVAFFAEVIFEPLLDTIRSFGIKPRASDQGRTNEKGDAVRDALIAGRVWYAEGIFFGQFNASISRELRKAGARWSDSRKGYVLALAELPLVLRNAVIQSAALNKELNSALLSQLAEMEKNITRAPLGVDYPQVTGKLVENLNKQFEKSVEKYEMIPKGELLNTRMRQGLTETLTENLSLSIKNFASERIPVLRKIVEQHAFMGGRADKLAKQIEAQFGISKRKAAFLADQETGLLIAQYRQQRYTAVGVRQYVWMTSHDERVRADHRILDGRIFSFHDPPITDRATGRRNNPGQDFRCRCVARAVLPEQSGLSRRNIPTVTKAFA